MQALGVIYTDEYWVTPKPSIVSTVRIVIILYRDAIMNGSTKLSQSTVTNFVSLAVFFLMLSTIACVVGDGGSNSRIVSISQSDSIEAKDGHVAVDNTITYNCDKHINLILFKTICVTPSGEVFVDDRGSVFIHNNFNTLNTMELKTIKQ